MYINIVVLVEKVPLNTRTLPDFVAFQIELNTKNHLWLVAFMCDAICQSIVYEAT